MNGFKRTDHLDPNFGPIQTKVSDSKITTIIKYDELTHIHRRGVGEVFSTGKKIPKKPEIMKHVYHPHTTSI